MWVISLFIIASLAVVSGCDDDETPTDGGLDADIERDADDDALIEPCPTDMVLIDDGLGLSFCIDRYEFPNVPGEEPTVDLPWHRARTACTDVGKVLCTEDEWVRACQGTPADLCAGDIGPTGSRPECVNDFGIHDMAGNVAEWTATPGTDVAFYVRGGSGADDTIGCDHRVELQAELRGLELGLRCCRYVRGQ